MLKLLRYRWLFRSVRQGLGQRPHYFACDCIFWPVDSAHLGVLWEPLHGSLARAFVVSMDIDY